MSFEEAEEIMKLEEFLEMKNIHVVGLMGMATLTKSENRIRKEFKSIKNYFDKLKTNDSRLTTLSMGMSSDYKIAIEEGSNLIRVGSLIFGSR